MVGSTDFKRKITEWWPQTKVWKWSWGQRWYWFFSYPKFLESAAAAKSLQSYSTLCGRIDGSPPGSSVSGILQARILEWVAISFSSACMLAKPLQSWLYATLWTAAHQAPLSMGFSRQEYWSRLPFPLQGIFLTQGLNPPTLQADSLPLSHRRNPITRIMYHIINHWINTHVPIPIHYL